MLYQGTLHANCVQGTGAAASLSPEASAPLGQGSPLDKFVRQVALLRDACLTPSGLDEELRRAAFPPMHAALWTRRLEPLRCCMP